MPIRTASPSPGCSSLLDGLLDAERSADGSLGVVLVADRRPEHAEDGVPDELVQRAAEGLDLPHDPPVEGPKRRLDVLGVGVIRAGREPDEVADQHGHALALGLAPLGRIGQRGSARHAEPRPVGVPPTA